MVINKVIYSLYSDYWVFKKMDKKPIHVVGSIQKHQQVPYGLNIEI
jgi:hypothetical protein